jgi:predicted ATP-dependent serine protease
MVCYQCGFETERESGRCPSCGGCLRKEDEERHLSEMDNEIEYERRLNEAICFHENQMTFTIS